MVGCFTDSLSRAPEPVGLARYCYILEEFKNPYARFFKTLSSEGMLMATADWKKTEKEYYVPGTSPAVVDIPTLGYFTIRGRGDPNGAAFSGQVGALYALAYAVRMSYRQPDPPPGYREYTVYPLEGLWDFEEGVIPVADHTGVADKNTLVYTLMIRQPDFVTPHVAMEIMDRVIKKKRDGYLEMAAFRYMTEGTCVQMMHHGPYDSEPASFARMHDFCATRSLVRATTHHHEIYITDPRKADPASMRTVLRYQVKPAGSGSE